MGHGNEIAMRLPAISSEEQDALFKDAYQTARVMTARTAPGGKGNTYKVTTPDALPAQFHIEYADERVINAQFVSRLTGPSIRETTSLNQLDSWTYIPAGDIDRLSVLNSAQAGDLMSARLGESLFDDYEDISLRAEDLAAIAELRFAERAIKRQMLRTYRSGTSSLGVKTIIEDGRPPMQQVVFRSEKTHRPDRDTKIEVAYSYGISHQNGQLIEPFATLEVASDTLDKDQLRDYAHAYARQNPTDYLFGCFDTLLEQIDDLDS